MKLIVITDSRMGMAFNQRRLSKDRKVIEAIQNLTKDFLLFLHPYSASLFPETANLQISENYLSLAGKNDFCFTERESVACFEESIHEIFWFCWNRSYPADTCLDLKLDSGCWHLESESVFEGFSHPQITLCHYIKNCI